MESGPAPRRLGRQPVHELDRVHDAVLGALERRVESGYGVCGKHVGRRHLAHGEAVVAQLRQRAPQVLGLLLDAREPQAAGDAVVAVEFQRAGQVRDALVGAPADLQVRARPLAPPDRDPLGIGLGRDREQEARVPAAR